MHNKLCSSAHYHLLHFVWVYFRWWSKLIPSHRDLIKCRIIVKAFMMSILSRTPDDSRSPQVVFINGQLYSHGSHCSRWFTGMKKKQFEVCVIVKTCMGVGREVMHACALLVCDTSKMPRWCACWHDQNAVLKMQKSHRDDWDNRTASNNTN